jgi:hypothetical protein
MRAVHETWRWSFEVCVERRGESGDEEHVPAVEKECAEAKMSSRPEAKAKANILLSSSSCVKPLLTQFSAFVRAKMLLRANPDRRSPQNPTSIQASSEIITKEKNNAPSEEVACECT